MQEINEEEKKQNPHRIEEFEKKYYFFRYVPFEFVISDLAEKILQSRNYAFYAIAVQLLMTILGFVLYIRRKIKVMLLINAISLLLTLIGLYGHLNINVTFIGIHCVLTTSIIGAFCLYTLTEIIVFLTIETDPEENYDLLIEFLCLFVYFIDFIIGCISAYILYLILKDKEKIKQQAQVIFLKGLNYYQEKLDEYQNNDDEEIKLLHDDQNQIRICIICCTSERNAAFVDCGHNIACYECATRVFQQNRRCPVSFLSLISILQICKKNIQQIIKLYS